VSDEPRKEDDDDLPEIAIPLLPGGVGATNAPPIPAVQPIADDDDTKGDGEG
jgi:hypothetical protein